MTRLQWTFDLLDRVTAPARRMGQALKATDAALKKVAGSGEAAQRALQRSFGLSERAAFRLTAAVATVGQVQGAIGGLQSRVGNLQQAFRGVADSVFNLKNALVAGTIGFAAKSVIDQVGFIEQQRIALGTILGSPIRAKAALSWAIQFADQTPFETPQVLEAMRSALAMGFNTRQIQPLLTTLGDTASALALGPSGLGELVDVFAQIRNSGNLITNDVRQLTNRGIPAFEILAKAFNTDVPTVRQMIEKGQIASEAALGILYRGLKARYGGSSAAQSRSIFGLISTLRSRPQTIAFRLEERGSLEPFRRVLSNLADLTDFNKPPGSTIGERLTAGIGGLFKAAFGPLATATEPKRAGDVILAFVNRATAAINRVRAAWPTVKAAVSDFISGVRSGFDLLANVWRTVEPLISGLSRLAGSFNSAQASMSGANVNAVKIIGTIAALAAAWRVLNLVTLGGAGAIARWGAVAVFSLIQAAGIGLPILWGKIGALTTLGVTALRASGQALLAGTRMAAAWLIGLGPIGWLIGGIAAISAALVLAYNKVSWFRNLVNRAWEGIKQIGINLLNWFTSLPERIGQVFGQLPNLLRGLLRRAIDLLPPGVRDVVRGLVGGLLDGSEPVENAAIQLADKTQQGFARPLEIRSPSRRFAYFGQMMGAGLEVGMRGSLGRVQRAAAGMTIAATLALGGTPAVSVAQPLPTPGLPPLIAPAPRASEKTINITIGPIAINSGSDAKQIAEELRTVAVEAVLEALERAASEEGA